MHYYRSALPWGDNKWMHRHRHRAGLGNACNHVGRNALHHQIPLFPNSMKRALVRCEGKQWCMKGLLRNRNVTLGRFLTRQGSCFPHTYTASCRRCWEPQQHSLAEMQPNRSGFLAIFLCLCNTNGWWRSHQIHYLAEQQPQRLLQVSSEKYFTSLGSICPYFLVGN